MTTPNIKGMAVGLGLFALACANTACSGGKGNPGFVSNTLPDAAADDDDDDYDDDDGDAGDDSGSGSPTTTTGPVPHPDPDEPPPDTGPAPLGGGDCCSDNGSPGCDDDEIEACVCAEDSFCCDTRWDDQCGKLVDSLRCGVCEDPLEPGGVGSTGGLPDPDPQPDPEPEADDTDGTTGTVEPATTGDDPEGGTGEPEPPPPMPAACCDALEEPGCSDPVLEQCVCDEDPYCCETAWDSLCVSEVDDLGCGVC